MLKLYQKYGGRFMKIKGKPATIWLGLPSDLLLGEAFLEIQENYIIERRKVFFENREVIMPILEVEGVEITKKGDKIFSILFIALLMGKFLILSLIPLIIYLLWRPTFLIIHGKNLQIGISIREKNLEPYREFAYEVMKKWSSKNLQP